MKVLILMGGKRVEGKNDNYPLYMVEIDKKMIIEWQMTRCQSLEPSEILCCVRAEDINDFHIDEIIKHNASNVTCYTIRSKTAGALCTALLAAQALDNDEELLILASNEMLEVDYLSIMNDFRKQDLDCGLVSFPSLHPRYSFAKIGKSGLVDEVAEKKPISKNALASFFYFKKGHYFVESAKNVIRKDNPLNGSFFVSQAINEMILAQKKTGVFMIEADDFHPLKTEVQLLQYMQERK